MKVIWPFELDMHSKNKTMNSPISIVLFVVMAGLVITGCSEDDDANGREALLENTWRIEDVTYVMTPALLPFFQGNSLICNLGDGSVLSIAFPEKPGASQAYDVIAPDATMGSSQCKVNFTLIPSPVTLYGGSGRTGDKVNVTVAGGRVRVEINEIEMFYFRNTTKFTTSLSANVKEE